LRTHSDGASKRRRTAATLVASKRRRTAATLVARRCLTVPSHVSCGSWRGRHTLLEEVVFDLLEDQRVE
jgi:hypothetical protein